MKIYTAHRSGDRLRLVPEGGSLAATVFGPLWLAFHGAWLGALGAAIVELLLGRAAAIDLAEPWPSACLAGIVAAIGMFGNDLRRAELAAGGYRPAGIVAGRDIDEARLRLADQALLRRVDRSVGET